MDSRRGEEAAGMALSDDLRKRVVEAVVLGGLSRNAATRRFSVSIASAVRGPSASSPASSPRA